MDERYYDAEKVAEILGLHVKTVHRYIREGKLRGRKVGKGWRVAGHDLSTFMEDNAAALDNGIIGNNQAKKISASAVVDIEKIDADEALRLTNTLTAVLNVKPESYGRSTMQTQYNELEGKLRVMLWGQIDFVEALLGSLAVLTQATEG